MGYSTDEHVVHNETHRWSSSPIYVSRSTASAPGAFLFLRCHWFVGFRMFLWSLYAEHDVLLGLPRTLSGASD